MWGQYSYGLGHLGFRVDIHWPRFPSLVWPGRMSFGWGFRSILQGLFADSCTSTYPPPSGIHIVTMFLPYILLLTVGGILSLVWRSFPIVCAEWYLQCCGFSLVSRTLADFVWISLSCNLFAVLLWINVLITSYQIDDGYMGCRRAQAHWLSPPSLSICNSVWRLLEVT